MQTITLGGESLTATEEQLKKIKKILGVVKKGRVEEAEKHLKYVKALDRVTRRIEELNGGEEGKWIIYHNEWFKINCIDKIVEYGFKLPYCATETIAQQIISEMESDLKIIFGV